MYCELSVAGRLAAGWQDWLAELAIAGQGEEETRLVGRLADQAALIGVLGRVQALNLRLLSVVCYADGAPVSSAPPG